MLPPKERMCHRCGFEKSCRDLVASEKCGRWAAMREDFANGTHATTYRCLDDTEVGLLAHMQGMLKHVVGAIDKLRDEQSIQHQASLASTAAMMQVALQDAGRSPELPPAEKLLALPDR